MMRQDGKGVLDTASSILSTGNGYQFSVNSEFLNQFSSIKTPSTVFSRKSLSQMKKTDTQQLLAKFKEISGMPKNSDDIFETQSK